MRIAIVVVAFNRLESVKRLIQSLLYAEYTDKVDLIISIDKSDTDIVERYAEGLEWPFGRKVVNTHKENLGLRQHMLSLGGFFESYDALVVLEDDVIVSPAFYLYTRQTVEKYFDNADVAGISLYSFPLNYLTMRPFEPYKNGYDVFFMQTAQSWGEIWMKQQWLAFYEWYLNSIDFLDSEDVPKVLFRWKKSWLKYHTRYCIERGLYFVYPYHSFSSNCGEPGTHSKQGYNFYQCSMQSSVVGSLKLPDGPDEGVCYDAFFENMSLYSSLGYPREELCLDINGFRGKHSKKRYSLSTQLLPFHIVKSFGLNRFPAEENVFKSISGNVINLYDTSITDSKPKGDTYSDFVLFPYRIISMVHTVYLYGIGRLVKEAFQSLLKKIIP